MPRPVANPPNPWASTHVEYLGEPPPAALEVYEERARTIIASNESPDIPFRHSVNPYRGCFHGCAYCFARPSHQYLGFGAGTDFERKIVVKTNAVELLREAFMHPRWQVRPVFLERLHEAVPLRAGKVISAIEQSRGGTLYDPRFGARMRGQGPRWAAIEALFEMHCRRLGFCEEQSRIAEEEPSTFRRPTAQQELF